MVKLKVSYYVTIYLLLFFLSQFNGHSQSFVDENCLVETQNGIVNDADCSCLDSGTCYNPIDQKVKLSKNNAYLRELQKTILVSMKHLSSGDFDQTVSTMKNVEANDKLNGYVERFKNLPATQIRLAQFSRDMIDIIHQQEPSISRDKIKNVLIKQFHLPSNMGINPQMARVAPEKSRADMAKNVNKRPLLAKKIRPLETEVSRDLKNPKIGKFKIISIQNSKYNLWRHISRKYLNKYSLLMQRKNK